MVDLKFVRDWHDYLACSLDYIVVVVDGRGTGFKGRKLRNTVKDNLGHWETVDQIAAARSVYSSSFVVEVFILNSESVRLTCLTFRMDGPGPGI